MSHHDFACTRWASSLTRTDEQLAEKYCGTGCHESAGELVRRYLPKVRGIVFPMFLDHQQADDLTQEIMIKAIAGLRGFQGQASLSTWVTRITLNTTYTFLQSRKRRSAEPLPIETVDRSLDHSPVQAAIGKELDARIRLSLQQLSPKLRAAMVLTAMQGLTAAEAAELEECSVSTMHWRIHQARKQLRKRLQEFVKQDGDES
jgi:RNA polymerase sigma-70 factor (ECF subfamily)